MGVRITSKERKVAIFDSVTGTAFGPVFDDEAEAEGFLQWCQAEPGALDPRELTDNHLAEAVASWRVFRAEASGEAR